MKTPNRIFLGAAALIAAHSLQAQDLPPLREGKCNQVTVTTQRSQGVGWVIRKKKSFYILTPAHVIEKYAKPKASCIGEVFSLTPIASSPTYDLALFKVASPPPSLTPILELPVTKTLPALKPMPAIARAQRDESGIVSYRIDGSYQIFPIPDHEDRAQIFSGTAETLSGIYHPLFPHPYSISSHAAIRPGMSGSAIYHLDVTDIPAGMLVKVLANSEHSLAIPISSILDLLPGLLAGQDPWVQKNPLAPRMDYVLRKEKRFRAITTPSDPATYTEVCSEGLGEVPSSGHWADGGSHWADGGADETANGQFMHSGPLEIPGIFEMPTIMTSFYKAYPSCSQEGFLDPKGRRFSALKNPAIKMTEAEALYPVIFQIFEKNPKTIQKRLAAGVAYDDDYSAVFNTFCSRSQMGWNFTRWLSKGGMLINHLNSDDQTINRATITLGAMKKPVFNPGKYKEAVGGILECDRSRQRLSLTYSYDNLDNLGEVQVGAVWDEKTVFTSIKIGTQCESAAWKPRQDFWLTHLKDEKMETVIELGLADEVASLYFLNIHPQCLIDPKAPPPALVQFSFSKTEE